MCNSLHSKGKEFLLPYPLDIKKGPELNLGLRRAFSKILYPKDSMRSSRERTVR